MEPKNRFWSTKIGPDGLFLKKSGRPQMGTKMISFPNKNLPPNVQGRRQGKNIKLHNKNPRQNSERILEFLKKAIMTISPQMFKVDANGKI